ncbi:MAG: right-handed parallel beta-helix repeat-containing protein, partial [Endomicrobiales bacterium]
MSVMKSGTISRDEIWSGEILVTGDVVVAPKATLTLLPGTVVLFAARSSDNTLLKRMSLHQMSKIPWVSGRVDLRHKCCIIVRGTLKAAGENDAKISIGNEGWGGSIMLYRRRPHEIRNCRIAYGAFGVMAGSDEAEITDSEFTDNTFGIFCKSACRIKGNLVRGNTIGIAASNCEPVITGNEIAGNSDTGILASFSKLTITGNRVSGNDLGILQMNSTENRIEENELSGNRIGVVSTNCVKCVIGKNTITGNTDAGIVNNGKNEALEVLGNEIGGSPRGMNSRENTEVTVTLNRFKALEVGMSFLDQSKGDVRENELREISEVGIECRDIAGVSLVKNVLQGVNRGIHCVDEAQAGVEGNLVESAGPGIECGGVAGVRVSGNTVTSAKESCVRYGMNAAGEVSGNVLKGRCGIEVSGTSHIRLEGNRVVTGETGINFRERSGGVVEGNDIQGEDGRDTTGICVSGGAEVSARSNGITKVVRGISASEQAQVRTEKNRIESLGTGIESSGAAAVRILGDEITSAGESCVRYGANAAGEVENVSLNGVRGIEAAGTSQVKVKGARIVAVDAGISYCEGAGG